METYYALGRTLVYLVIVINCIGLAVLTWAVLKHRRLCFTLLTIGAVFGFAYSILAGIPFFIHISLHAHIVLARVLLALVAVTAIIGLWGWVLLVRSYRSSV